MKRLAWIDLALATGLTAFIVWGMSDATPAIELAAHGALVIVLLIGWEWLENSGVTAGLAVWQVAGGVLLCLTPIGFRHGFGSLVGIADLVAGTAATALGLREATEIM